MDAADSQANRFGRVERVSEGYYWFHLPATADQARVKEMTHVFEQTRDSSGWIDSLQSTSPAGTTAGKPSKRQRTP
jgi:hypothetical protein